MESIDPDEGMEVARLTLSYLLMPDGSDTVVIEASDNAGDVPPLVTMFGMLEMGKDAACELWATGGEGYGGDQDAGD